MPFDRTWAATSVVFTRRRALGGLLAVPLLCAGCISGGDAKLTGTDLGKHPAPDFTLTDHRGETIRLSELHGRAVVLNFIYTNCPDVCPLTAENLAATWEMLSEKTRGKVVYLAITVDPTRDTPEQLQKFSEVHGLAAVAQWHALTADRATLEAVWTSYGIDPGEVQAEVDSHLNGSGRPLAFSHTDALYVIDREGRERVLLHSDFDPNDLAKNLKTLTS